MSNKFEQLWFKLEKIGIGKHAGKVRKHFDPTYKHFSPRKVSFFFKLLSLDHLAKFFREPWLYKAVDGEKIATPIL